MNRFCVLGSMNMDLVTRVARFPRPGETLTGTSFQIFPGGKGANQAVALARLGAKVSLVAARGRDVLGDQYEQVLVREDIDKDSVAVVAGVSTGTATIVVDADGENFVLIVPGANASVTPEFVEDRLATLKDASTLLLQLEIPLESVTRGAQLAKQAGARVILDPAPARDLPEALLREVDILTPNETEAQQLTGIDTKDETGIRRAAETLLERGVGCVVVKAGGRGAFVCGPEGFTHVPGFAVHAVDTVAAGDSFNAGLAYALAEGFEMIDAVRFANAVAGLSTTKEGAQSAMPSLAETEALMRRG
jgi:ribokinase